MRISSTTIYFISELSMHLPCLQCLGNKNKILHIKSNKNFTYRSVTLKAYSPKQRIIKRITAGKCRETGGWKIAIDSISFHDNRQEHSDTLSILPRHFRGDANPSTPWPSPRRPALSAVTTHHRPPTVPWWYFWFLPSGMIWRGAP